MPDIKTMTNLRLYNPPVVAGNPMRVDDMRNMNLQGYTYVSIGLSNGSPIWMPLIVLPEQRINVDASDVICHFDFIAGDHGDPSSYVTGKFFSRFRSNLNAPSNKIMRLKFDWPISVAHYVKFGITETDSSSHLNQTTLWLNIRSYPIFAYINNMLSGYSITLTGAVVGTQAEPDGIQYLTPV